MSSPWDIPSFPVKGDPTESITFEAVGRVLSQWEAVEFDLSMAFSSLAGAEYDDGMREYGQGNIFRDRLASLRDKARETFQRSPDQAMEGDFDRLTNEAEGFSARRNEVAHGFVFNVAPITFFSQRLRLSLESGPQFLLIPTYYAKRHHGADGMPLYAYNSQMLKALNQRLFDLQLKWSAFNKRWFVE